MGNTHSVERADLVISGASFAGIALAAGLAQSLGSTFRIVLVDRSAPPARSACSM